jgi:hypothetical protein
VKKGSSSLDAAKKVARAIKKWPLVDSQEITLSTVHSWWREYKEAMESDSGRQDVETLVSEMLNKDAGGAYLEHILESGPPRLGGLVSEKRSLPPG